MYNIYYRLYKLSISEMNWPSLIINRNEADFILLAIVYSGRCNTLFYNEWQNIYRSSSL